MKASKKSFHKFKIALFALILMTCSILGLVCIFPQKNVYAASEYENVTSNLTSNSGFDNRVSSSTFPAQPSNFSYGNVAKDADDKYVHGVIDLTADDVNYANSKPEEHKYVLMMNGLTSGSKFEYKTSNTISLSASSFYYISVDVYTNNSDGIGKLVVYDDNDSPIEAISNIATTGWSTYYFFIYTNQFDGAKMKLGLNLDGKGVILYDNIAAYKTSAKYLQTKIESLPATYYSLIDYRDDSSIELGTSGFAVDGVASENGGANQKISQPDRNLDANAYDGEHTSALKIENTTETYNTFVRKNFVTIEQNNIYKITITAKSTLSKTATLKLLQTNLQKDEQATNSSTISISSSSTSNLTNDYLKYSFYIKASSQKDTSYDLQLKMGEEESKATGSLYISSITLTKINSTNYSNAGSSNNVKLDLTSGENSDTSKYFENGEFNLMEISDAKNPLPATPTSWTINAGNNSRYGIVNTETEAFKKLALPNLVENPRGGKNDNVLMMYNATANTISCTSASKEVAANAQTGYYAISMEIKPILADVEISFYNSNDGSNVKLGSLNLPKEDVVGWKTVQFAIYNPYQTLNLVVEIKMTSTAAAACFVDNVTFNYNRATDTTIALDKVGFDSFNGTKIDLSNLFATEGNEDFAKSKFFVGDGDLNNGLAGIIDIQNSTLEGVLPQSAIQGNEHRLDNLKKAKQFNNPNIIGIYAPNDIYYNLTSNLGFKLDASSYYKFSIDVFTPVLPINDDQETGVKISLSSFEENFANIVAADDWQTYTFYINPDNSTTAYITLGLGNENVKCQGRIFFGNIQFEQFESEDEFNEAAIANKTSLVLKQVKAEENNNDEDNKEETTGNSNRSNWFYYVPSIIFAVVIIVCIIGVVMRKVKWKKPVKKSKTTYDRNKTVSKQYYTRKAIAMREEKLRELEKELADMTGEREKYEEEYKKDLTKMRELKIKRASSAEISKLEKDMKKNRKLSSALGLSIQKQENEIEYVKSEAYLNSQVKKLSTEKVADTADDKTTETEQPENKTEK